MVVILGVCGAVGPEEVVGEVPEAVLGDLPEGFADDGAGDVDVVEYGAAVGPVHAACHGGVLLFLLLEQFQNVVGTQVDVVEEDDLCVG